MKKYFQQFLFGSSLNDNKLLNIAWLLFRVQIGLSIALHAGLPKLENGLAPGWFINQVSGLGFNFPSASFWAAIAVWGEFAGGLFIALGFLTRFSALQLAFQFFVISFLWYENPEPFTGMYFQHSLFWGFTLISFVGAGKYSIDKLIMDKKIEITTMTVKPTTVVLLLLLLFACSGLKAQTTVTKNEFNSMIGKWKGTLTYLDYTSGKPYTMPANVAISKNKSNEQQLIFAWDYPQEPKANGNDTLTMNEAGTMLDEATVVSKTNENGVLKIIAERNGVDGNDHKKAVIRYVYTISKKSFIKRKEVKFEGHDNFIMRNEFKMNR